MINIISPQFGEKPSVITKKTNNQDNSLEKSFILQNNTVSSYYLSLKFLLLWIFGESREVLQHFFTSREKLWLILERTCHYGVIIPKTDAYLAEINRQSMTQWNVWFIFYFMASTWLIKMKYSNYQLLFLEWSIKMEQVLKKTHRNY